LFMFIFIFIKKIKNINIRNIREHKTNRNITIMIIQINIYFKWLCWFFWCNFWSNDLAGFGADGKGRMHFSTQIHKKHTPYTKHNARAASISSLDDE
jgi:hypothetical protein